MINQTSIDAIHDVNFNQRFKKPLYESYCFSNIPNTIKSLFGIDSKQSLPKDVYENVKANSQQVVLFVLDGFGWNLFQKHKASAFLTTGVEKGTVSKLTTQFPSTTTSNITTITTGLPLSKTGVYEWFFYDPTLDDVICPLLYKRAGQQKKLSDEGIPPEVILPKENLFTELSQHGVKSYSFQYALFNKSCYSSLTLKNSEVIDFETLEEGLHRLQDILKKGERAYYYFYHADIDSMSHDFGPYSKEAELETLRTLDLLQQFYNDCPEDVILLVTADHGQTTVKKERAFYVNLECQEILPYLKTKKNGEFVIPCGSFRDFFLHVKKDHIDDVVSILAKKLNGIAEVYKVNDLVTQGLFGLEPSKDFFSRIGDVVILPYKDEAVWWYDKDRFQIKHQGMHGGLLDEELEIPFIVIQK